MMRGHKFGMVGSSVAQDHEHREYISRSQVLLWLGGAGIAVFSALWTLLMAHSTGAHEKNVSQVVYEQTLQNQAEWRDEQRRDIGEIKEAVNSINRQLLARAQGDLRR